MIEHGTPTLLLAAALLGVASGGLAAQQTQGDLVGVVVEDAHMTALPGVRVTILDKNRSAVTDDDGSFTFEGLTSGTVSVQIEKPGFVKMVEDIQVDPGELTLVRFEVPALTAILDELTVAARRRAAVTNLAESVVDGDDDQTHAQTAVDLLASRIPGVLVTRGDNTMGHSLTVLIRGVSSVSLSNAPAVYVDGTRMEFLDQLLDIPASDVARIRVLRGASSESRYPDSANGVIIIETRRGPGGTGEEA